MIPIGVGAVGPKKNTKILNGCQELTILDATIGPLDSINVLSHSSAGGQKELGLLVVDREGGNPLNDHKAPEQNMPSHGNIADSKSQIITEWQQDMINRRQSGINESDEGIVPKNKKLHRTRVTLLDPGRHHEGTEEEVPEANDGI